MNNYQKELNKIHMNEELKDKIRLFTNQEKKPKYYFRHSKLIFSISIGMCVLLFINYTINHLEKQHTIPNEQYIPQQYSVVEENMYSYYESEREEFLYNETIYNIEQLPVYTKTYSDTKPISKQHLKEQETKAERIWKELYTQVNKDYELNDYIIETNGDILFEIETKESNNIKETLYRIAQDLLMLPTFKNLDTKTSCETSNDETCKILFMEKELNEKQTLIQQIYAPYIDYRDMKYYLTLPYQVKLKLVKEYDIMTLEDAEKVLLQGGYYTTQTVSSFTSNQIEHVELVYGGIDDLNKVYDPYVLPIYRWYIKQKDNIICLEVPEIYPDDIKKLEKKTWYFKKRE